MQADTPPLAVHRQAPTMPMPSLTEIQEAARLLTQGSAPAPAPAPDPPPGPQPFPNTQMGPPLTELPAKAPKGYKIRTEVPLDAGTAQALDMATRFQEKANPPREGKDGRLIYTYGAGLPVLVCAP